MSSKAVENIVVVEACTFGQRIISDYTNYIIMDDSFRFIPELGRL